MTKRIFIGSLNVGDLVMLSASESDVRSSFADIPYRWDDKMRDMLGKRFKILLVLRNGIIALPSPDGSNNGKLHFHKSVVKRVKGK